ncbi:MAG: radical SAM protein [Deltaproteobacteria bacterium]|nr:radical SAM protein [Deltaproteobacteria bacterium]
MRIRLIYPKWPKLEHQTEWHLPPHGPVVFAACVPPEHDLKFTDENIDPVDLNERPDLVCISMMLTCQTPRGYELGDHFRAQGVPVIFGGISTMLHAEETAQHADAVFLGEAEGRFAGVLADLQAGKLKKLYDYLETPAPVESVGTARRSILKRELYNYRGMQMVDLVHASRGCRFNCYPCCVRYLGGRSFRPRPIDQVVAEVESIPNNRLFFVDNSLAQNKQWEIDLFRALAPLKRSIISHPIEDDLDVLKAASDAGAWYIYQAVFDTSQYIRDRVKRYKDHGIAVEGTILLGLDEHDEDYVKRLVDFLLEIELDLAEFTVLTPFPHTRTWDDYQKEGRILHTDWKRYTAGEVVFKPAKMSIDKLQELYHYAWNTFYKDEPHALKMGRVLKRAMRREEKWGTKDRFNPKADDAKKFGKAIAR